MRLTGDCYATCFNVRFHAVWGAQLQNATEGKWNVTPVRLNTLTLRTDSQFYSASQGRRVSHRNFRPATHHDCMLHLPRGILSWGNDRRLDFYLIPSTSLRIRKFERKE